jgi:hypothetical protein
LQTYAILRRGGWRTAADLGAAAERSTAVGESMSDEVRWIRSYALEEPNGSVGTVCVYEAVSPEAIRRHAAKAALPIDEILRVADVIVVRPDPRVIGASVATEMTAAGAPGVSPAQLTRAGWSCVKPGRRLSGESERALLPVRKARRRDRRHGRDHAADDVRDERRQRRGGAAARHGANDPRGPVP